MFVGHYGPALALKRWSPATPIVLLFLAVQLVDVAWAIFVLTGVEHVRIIPGFTETNALDLYYMPYTHSLDGAALWALAAGAVTWFSMRSLRPAVAVGLAVFSHWLLDLIMHTHDLPLVDNTMKVGFGLWNYRWPALALELATLLVGCVLYARGTRPRDRIGGIGLWLFAAVLVVAQVGLLLGPQPPTPPAMAISALVAYVAFALIALWIDRHRESA